MRRLSIFWSSAPRAYPEVLIFFFASTRESALLAALPNPQRSSTYLRCEGSPFICSTRGARFSRCLPANFPCGWHFILQFIHHISAPLRCICLKTLPSPAPYIFLCVSSKTIANSQFYYLTINYMRFYTVAFFTIYRFYKIHFTRSPL